MMVIGHILVFHLWRTKLIWQLLLLCVKWVLREGYLCSLIPQSITVNAAQVTCTHLAVHVGVSSVRHWELMYSALCFVWHLLQEWLCHFRRPVLETGCLAVFHSWPSLAWCRVPSTFRTTSQVDGVRYDRILHSEVCIAVTAMLWSLQLCFVRLRNGSYRSTGNDTDKSKLHTLRN